MKKILLSISILSLISLLFLSACSQGVKLQDYTQNKAIAEEFLLNSNIFKQHVGFDIQEPDPSVKTCGNNCYEFTYRYSTLGEIIGYETTIQVINGEPKFTKEPIPLN